METAHQTALDLLKHNHDLLERMSLKLLESEVIEGEALKAFLDEAKTLGQDEQHVGEAVAA
mgnify:CR=1 FL=1